MKLLTGSEIFKGRDNKLASSQLVLESKLTSEIDKVKRVTEMNKFERA